VIDLPIYIYLWWFSVAMLFYRVNSHQIPFAPARTSSGWCSQHRSLRGWMPKRPGRGWRRRSLLDRGPPGLTVEIRPKFGWSLGDGFYYLGKCCEFQQLKYRDILDILYLVGGDWNHGILNDFPETFGNVIIPTDELIFVRGVGQPPTSIALLRLSWWTCE